MGIFKLNGIDYMGGGGGGNANEQVLTYDEYLALSEEEKTNGTTYYINDINGEGKDQFQPIIYSEEEREIGIWTNGKPLYQRTLFYTGDTTITVSGNSGSAYSVTGITDIYANDILPTLDQLVHYRIDLTGEGNEKNIYHFEYCFQASTGTFMRSHNPDIAYIGYNIIPGSSITLQYTKTTDQPGSGTWTPQGVPAVHYSTDEQIAGTWIDGSTLYEKTIKKQNISSVSSSTVLIPSSELTGMNIIEIGGSYVSRTSNSTYAINTYINSNTIIATWLAESDIYYWLYWGAADTYDAYITIRYTKS